MKNFAILLFTLYILLLMTRKHLNKRLSKNFTLFEFTKTYTGFDNYPPEKVQKNLQLLVDNVLQPLRDFFGKPVIVNSGYRSKKVNEEIGGSQTSDHLDGNAADIRIDGVTNGEIIKAVKLLKLPVKQVIDERLYNSSGVLRSWLHIAHEKGNNKGEFLTARNTIENLKPIYSYA